MERRGLGAEQHGHHPTVPPAAVPGQHLHWSQALNFPLHFSASSGASSSVLREKRVGWAASRSCECALWPLEKDRAGHLPAALRLLSASLNFTADKSWASRAPPLACLSPNNLDQEIFSSSGVIMTHYGSTVSASFDGAGAVAVSVLAISHILHTSCSLSKGYQSHTEGLRGKERTALCLCSRAQTPSPQAASPPVPLRTSRVEFSFLSGGGGGTSSAAFEAHFPSSLS